MVENGIMTRDEFNKISDLHDTQKYRSKLNFLNDHNGLRPGEIHTILGPKGGGKSTLVRTIIIEILQNMKKAYCFLSEEETHIYKAPIYKVFKKIIESKISNQALVEEKTNSFMTNLLIESQFNLRPENRRLYGFIARLEFIIKEKDIQVFIMDNTTTSFINRLKIDQQAEAIELLKEIAVKYSIVIILVLHTAKGTDINKIILDGDHVRGNATSINMGSYNYLIQTYFRCEPPRVFLTTDKARYHQKANKKVYELHYDRDLEMFTHDIKSDYNQIKKVMKDLRKEF